MHIIGKFENWIEYGFLLCRSMLQYNDQSDNTSKKSTHTKIKRYFSHSRLRFCKPLSKVFPSILFTPITINIPLIIKGMVPFIFQVTFVPVPSAASLNSE